MGAPSLLFIPFRQYYLLITSMTFTSSSLLFRSVPFSARDRFHSIPFAMIPFDSILFVSMFARDFMDLALYKPLYE